MAASTSREAVGRDQRTADVLVHHMPRPKSERETWEDELKELPALLSKLHRELAATPEKTDEELEPREALQWNIRRVEHRIVDLRSRLTTDDAPDRDDQENTR
jgi:hypothetical protein